MCFVKLNVIYLTSEIMITRTLKHKLYEDRDFCYGYSYLDSAWYRVGTQYFLNEYMSE